MKLVVEEIHCSQVKVPLRQIWRGERTMDGSDAPVNRSSLRGKCVAPSSRLGNFSGRRAVPSPRVSPQVSS